MPDSLNQSSKASSYDPQQMAHAVGPEKSSEVPTQQLVIVSKTASSVRFARKPVREDSRTNGAEDRVLPGPSMGCSQENATLKDELARAEVQMAKCIEDRDTWEASYRAVLEEKQKLIAQRPSFSVWDMLNRETPGIQQRCESAENRLRSLTQTNHRIRRRNQELERDLTMLKSEGAAREQQCLEAARVYTAQQQAMIDDLEQKCSDLMAQMDSQNSSSAIEDEEAVVKAFRRLNANVKNWCLGTWDLWPKHSEVTFSRFPLSHVDCLDKVSLYDSRLLIACIWEWLLRDVFGHLRQTPNDYFDLWLTGKIARYLKTVEDEITTLQKSEKLQEWKSLTMQCLSGPKDQVNAERVDIIVDDVEKWIECRLPPELRATPGLNMRIAKFRMDVVYPAVALSHTLRKRFTPIVVASPSTIEIALREWRRSREERPDSASILMLATTPELRRFEVATLKDENPLYSVIETAYIDSVMLEETR